MGSRPVDGQGCRYDWHAVALGSARMPMNPLLNILHCRSGCWRDPAATGLRYATGPPVPASMSRGPSREG